jgi:hypothetical protein
MGRPSLLLAEMRRIRLACMRSFVMRLNARLEADGFLSSSAKAKALGLDPATWSRAQRGLIRFSARVVQAGLARYPELVVFLADLSAKNAA